MNSSGTYPIEAKKLEDNFHQISKQSAIQVKENENKMQRRISKGKK